MITQDNQSTWRKTCPIATLSSKNPTRTGVELNPRPAVKSGKDNASIKEVIHNFLEYLRECH
jgi:hypothetical protein